MGDLYFDDFVFRALTFMEPNTVSGLLYEDEYKCNRGGAG